LDQSEISFDGKGIGRALWKTGTSFGDRRLIMSPAVKISEYLTWPIAHLRRSNFPVGPERFLMAF
jgi:hypothetical protein